nr:hypothetical protein [uncultured Blautia sp.]
MTISTDYLSVRAQDPDYILSCVNKKYISKQGNECRKMHIKGTVIHVPFQVHMKYLNTDSKLSEVYLYGDEKNPDTIALTDDSDEWRKINSVVYTHEYGYGHELKFEKDREETINDIETIVYTTSYTEDMGETYKLE